MISSCLVSIVFSLPMKFVATDMTVKVGGGGGMGRRQSSSRGNYGDNRGDARQGGGDQWSRGTIWASSFLVSYGEYHAFQPL